jgi:hypothetical protein
MLRQAALVKQRGVQGKMASSSMAIYTSPRGRHRHFDRK